MPQLAGLNINDNHLTELRAEALRSAPNLVLFQAKNNAIRHIDPAWIDWLADIDNTGLLDGNPLVCDSSRRCSCAEGYFLIQDGLGPAGATCVPACPERVPRFFATLCPQRLVGDTCTVSCDTTVDSDGQPQTTQTFDFICGANRTWVTNATDGGVCDKFLCGTLSFLGQDKSCRCTANPSYPEQVRCFDTWPQGLPATLIELEVISWTTFAAASVGLAWTDVAALRGMTSITLANGKLEAVPEQLLKAAPLLTRLKKLDLLENAFSRIPPGLDVFPALRTLDFTGNPFTRLDFSELHGLVKLDTVVIRAAQISSLVASNQSALGILSTLKVLRLSGNKLSSLGSVLTRLSRLNVLDLHSNLLTALHGTELPSASKLRQINVRNNRIRHIDRSALFQTLDWDRFASMTPQEALQSNKSDREGFGDLILSEGVMGVYMEGNPSNCTWEPLPDNDKRIVCDCDSGLRGAIACPQLEAFNCSVLDFVGSGGSGQTLTSLQLCDGIADCPGGEDERFCDNINLRLFEDPRVPVARIPYDGFDNCTSCFHRLSGTLARGILRFVSQRADGSGRCVACDETDGLMISSERAILSTDKFLMRCVCD
ncbi:MAG: hypothetical protein CML43_13975 [Rhodobacteraceae bacterium]|nr:hypothetical protein [Paracoccaceae bacterium]